jgi:two-component system cell cycle response regulator
LEKVGDDLVAVNNQPGRKRRIVAKSIEKTILVVDDTPGNVTLLSRILVNQGYHVISAENGPSAIRCAQDARPDLILLDILMPEMDGFTTSAHLKNDNCTRDIPIIFISALDSIDDKINAFHAGGVDYILKPFDIEEVLARVETHLTLRKLQSQLESTNRELAARVEELTCSQELLKQREDKLKAFVDALPNPAFIYDETGCYLEILANEEALLAASPEALLGKQIEEALPPDAAKTILSAIRQAIESGKPQVIEYKIPVQAGGERWFEGRLALMDKAKEGHARVVLVATDIDERVRLYQEVQRLANIDSLTACNNRRHFLYLADQQIQLAVRYKHPLSLLMLDIDHFKAVNDRFGHQVGDQILASLAQLCLKNLRSVDIFGRYGGEEFLALLPETPLERALIAAGRLRSKIEQMKTNIETGELSITVSIGISIVDHENGISSTIDDLISKADHALYEAKAAGRNCIRAY